MATTRARIRTRLATSALPLAVALLIALTASAVAAPTSCSCAGGGGGGVGGTGPAFAGFTFSPGSPMSGTSVSFDSSTTTGDPASYDWDFGDGTAHSTAANPSHTFQYPGQHHVTLTVTATDSSQSAVAHDVAVGNWPPSAAFSTSSTPRLSQPVSFSNESFDLDSQTPITYQWAFGDGATSTSREPTHTYATPGTKTVTLTVTDDRGATATVSHDIDVADDSVHADITFAPTGPATGEAVSFDGHASSAQGIDSYKWTFDDGGTSTDAAPAHAFATAGDHTVQLMVTSAWGVTFATSATVHVQAPAGNPGGGPVSGDPGSGAGSPGSGNPGSGGPNPGGPNPGGGQTGGSGSPGTSQPGGGTSTDKPKPGKKKKHKKAKKCIKQGHGKGARGTHGKKGACVKKHGHKGGKKPGPTAGKPT